jgi:hypothetical protein
MGKSSLTLTLHFKMDKNGKEYVRNFVLRPMQKCSMRIPFPRVVSLCHYSLVAEFV